MFSRGLPTGSSGKLSQGQMLLTLGLQTGNGTEEEGKKNYNPQKTIKASTLRMRGPRPNTGAAQQLFSRMRSPISLLPTPCVPRPELVPGPPGTFISGCDVALLFALGDSASAEIWSAGQDGHTVPAQRGGPDPDRRSNQGLVRPGESIRQ